MPEVTVNVGTIAGIALVTGILVQILTRPLAPATLDRFGPLIALAVGILVAELGVFALPVFGRADIIGALWLGVLGASAAALGHDAASALGAPV